MPDQPRVHITTAAIPAAELRDLRGRTYQLADQLHLRLLDTRTRNRHPVVVTVAIDDPPRS